MIDKFGEFDAYLYNWRWRFRLVDGTINQLATISWSVEQSNPIDGSYRLHILQRNFPLAIYLFSFYLLLKLPIKILEWINSRRSGSAVQCIDSRYLKYQLQTLHPTK